MLAAAIPQTENKGRNSSRRHVRGKIRIATVIEERSLSSHRQERIEITRE